MMVHNDILIKITYLLSVVFFIYGLKKLGSPKTARSGNTLSAVGMFIAVIATLIDKNIFSYQWIILAIVVGALLGLTISYYVKMTAMPQMVALLNGFGGASSAFVALSEYYTRAGSINQDLLIFVTLMLSLLIGFVTLSGSLIAFSKLQGILSGNPIVFPLQKIVSLLLFMVLFLFAYLLYVDPLQNNFALFFVGISFLLGILTVISIGGADMPVVVSLLNSYSGIAVSMTGFVLQNYALIIVGSLVGASGIILTNIMCKGMNRSLLSVLAGGFGGSANNSSATSSTTTGQNVKSSSAEEVAMLLDIANHVIIVPGYGMAVSQAQHVAHKLVNLLIDRGVNVKFGIHPVAGRMPGHMNVLLAEAGIEYELLYDMDHINSEFSQADVTIIVGANDVVNPDAKTNKDSPIYGMPVLNVEESRSVVVLKRSMNPGFAGIENQLFYLDNTLMVFGDAKKTLDEMILALEEI